MKINLKGILFMLGAAVAVQPTQTIAMESVKAFATNHKWSCAALAGLGTGLYQMYGGDLLKKYVFNETALPYVDNKDNKTYSATDVNTLITKTNTIARDNKEIGELSDDTTGIFLKSTIDILVPKQYELITFASNNSHNFYRSVKTVKDGASKWYQTLTAKQAVMTGISAAAGMASTVAPKMIAKDNVAAAVLLSAIARTYRNRILLWVSQLVDDQSNVKFNKNVADVIDMSCGVYYRA